MAFQIDKMKATANQWPATPIIARSFEKHSNLDLYLEDNSIEGAVAAKKDLVWRHRIIALLISATAFAGSLFLNTRHNTFPYGFHPDEPSKADQILSGYRNFLHPQLMLEVTQLALNFSQAPRDLQHATELGRQVSAVFAAIGVAAICVIGYLSGGASGAFLLGVSCTCCSSLCVSAHYFKEDTSLVMGFCLVLLATRCVMMPRSRSGEAFSVIFLGLACAIAASGKYIGAVFLIMGLAAVIAAPVRSRRLRIARSLWLLAVFAIFAVAINYRALVDPFDFRRGFESEAKHAVTDHFGLTMNHPNGYFIENLPAEAGWPMVILGAVAILILLATWRRRNNWDVLSILVGPGYLLVLSFSSLAAGRYLLPMVMMLHVTAGLSALWVIDFARKSASRIVMAIAFASVFAFIGLPRCLSVVHQFGDDSRDRLRAWLIANVPSQSIVVGDFYTGMVIHARDMHGQDTIGSGIAVREVYDASSYGPISSLRRQGISYIAVSDRIYDHYFLPQLHPAPAYQRQFDEQRQWYVDLFANHAPVWEYDPPMNLHASTNPAIRLYRIDGH